ncbi:MAG: LbtU family siderophore porin [Chlamydiales bacterium]|nr:LbtU family siderophore porin [Chlamydiales bacterium]
MKRLIALCLLTSSLFAIQEGTFAEYQDVQQKNQQEALRQSYQNPLLKEIEAPTKKKELTLQQQIVDYFGTFVTSSPYPGVRATYEGNELMSSLSNVNKDLMILLELEQAIKFMKEEQIPYPIHPRIFMSGDIEFTGYVQRDAGGHAGSDLDLVQAELDFLIVMAPWVYGFVAINYDYSVDPTLSRSRVANSRIKGESMFVTFGDLSYTPWYLTIGQTYLPFGQYTTYNAIQDPLTKILFRTFARDVTVGFYNDFMQVAVFALKGDSHSDSGHNVNNYGMNLGFHFHPSDFDGKIGVGFIRNMADSLGMQVAFGDPSNTEQLHKVVPAIDANFNFTWKCWNLIGEYNQALRPFDERDASFSSNGTTFKGARPRAFDVELAYSFAIGKRDSSLAFSYSRSWNSLGFNVPKERMSLTWAYHLFRGNLLSIELTSDKLYAKNNRAGGNIATGTPYYLDPSHLGHRDYTFGIDYLIYF